jgi:hypothetical protein
MSAGKLIGVQVISGSYTPRPGLKSVHVAPGATGGAGGSAGSHFKVLTVAKFSGVARAIGEGGGGSQQT